MHPNDCARTGPDPLGDTVEDRLRVWDPETDALYNSPVSRAAYHEVCDRWIDAILDAGAADERARMAEESLAVAREELAEVREERDSLAERVRELEVEKEEAEATALDEYYRDMAAQEAYDMLCGV